MLEEGGRPVAECGRPLLGSLPLSSGSQGIKHEPLDQVEQAELGRRGTRYPRLIWSRIRWFSPVTCGPRRMGLVDLVDDSVLVFVPPSFYSVPITP